MKYSLALLFMLIGGHTFAQHWHASSDTLKEPPNPMGFYASVRYFNRYDTVPCTYLSTDSKHTRKGYKFIYVLNGFYTDNAQTFQVFFDGRLRRVYNVQRFFFN